MSLLFGINFAEIVVVLVVMLLLFGTRLPRLMRSFGRGISEFKKGLKDPDDKHPSSGSPPAER